MTLQASGVNDRDEAGAVIDAGYVDDVDDDELVRVLEALLLVADSPVSAETLGSVTEQPVHRISDILRRIGDGLTARDSGIELREVDNEVSITFH